MNGASVFENSGAKKNSYSNGSLGLILPDYSKYTKDRVEKTCMGEDSNLNIKHEEFIFVSHNSLL